MGNQFTEAHSETFKLRVNQHSAASMGLELIIMRRPEIKAFEVKIWERNSIRRLLLCETSKAELHEINSWTQQQLNDYSTWR